jgi:DNA-binding NarL/FixJ family response regulator
MEKTVSILVTARNDHNIDNIIAAVSAQNDLQIIGVENDETGTIIKSERLKPDVLIMDLQSHEMDGVELVPIIHRRSPSTLIIIMCDRDENDYAAKALKAGVSGYMLREKDKNKLIPVIRIVILGGFYVSASITIRALDSFISTKQFPKQAIETNKQHKCKKKLLFLSPTERGIILDIAQGYSDNEIANHLNLSAGTIKNYLTAIKRKTKLNNRIQIVLYSLAAGLIKLEQLDILKTDNYQNPFFY